MKSTKLFESLNDIDEEIIKEAEIEDYIPQKRFTFTKVLLPVAAILLFIILPNFIKKDINVEKSLEDTNLPITDQNLLENKELAKISMGSFNTQGAGFEALMAYNIVEIINANPWNENLQISTLPVFKNKLGYSQQGIPTNIDIEAMRKRLDKTIRLLNINPKELEITDDYPSEEEIQMVREKFEIVGDEMPDDFLNINQIYGKSKKYEITVSNDLTTTINFKPKDKIVKEYYTDYYAPYEDIYRTAQYVSKEYKDILQMIDTVINLYDGAYTYNGDQSFEISFFEGEGSLEEQIINYNLNYTEFYFDEEDMSNTLRVHKPDLSQKIGNYPIISSKEAEALLISNKYITNVPEDFPGEEYIKKV
ncbi:MAG: hypothetical protein ACTHW2_04360, partial [Tissierella sp.]|uniref:hypothetical protein n=1 Tax=Tissierella sp. TaxID=41274 RepID=UPI003F9E0030